VVNIGFINLGNVIDRYSDETSGSTFVYGIVSMGGQLDRFGFEEANEPSSS
jgi:hypothetical protein